MVGQLVADAEVEVAIVEVVLAWIVLEGRTLLGDVVTGTLDTRVLLTGTVTLDANVLEGWALLEEADWHEGQALDAEDEALLEGADWVHDGQALEG